MTSLVAPPTAEQLIATEALTESTEKPETPQSENVNLFQSLRVLQEGESEGEEPESSHFTNPRRLDAQANQTCLKTSTFSALTATFSVLVCALSVALMMACARLKQRKKESSLYDTYVTHKGQID